LFANNDLVFIDRKGCNHESFSEGLRKSLYNFMHGICFDYPLREWFDFRIPQTTVAPHFIHQVLSQAGDEWPDPNSMILWTGGNPAVEYYTRNKKGKTTSAVRLIFQTRQAEVVLRVNETLGNWLLEIFPGLSPHNSRLTSFHELEQQYTGIKQGDFRSFWNGPVVKLLRENGLLVL
jgi:hypothetical protein